MVTFLQMIEMSPKCILNIKVYYAQREVVLTLIRIMVLLYRFLRWPVLCLGLHKLNLKLRHLSRELLE